MRLGVVGCADIAVRRTLPALAAVDGLSLTAVASRDGDRARRCADTFGGTPVHGYAELLARPDVDAVYLPLPAGLHVTWAERALLAGKHVLVEKPFATSRAEAERVFAVAEAGGLVAMESMMFVHHRQHRTVRDLVDDGAIGELRAMTACFSIPPRPSGDIRLRSDIGGGALLDLGVYPLRAALYHLGDELHVDAAELRHDRSAGVDVAGRASLRSADGVVAEVEFGMTGPYLTAYRLTGSAGSITVRRPFTPPDDHRPVLDLVRGGVPEQRELDPDRQFVGSLAAFRDAVRASGGHAAWTRATLLQARLVDRVRALAGPVDAR